MQRAGCPAPPAAHQRIIRGAGAPQERQQVLQALGQGDARQRRRIQQALLQLELQAAQRARADLWQRVACSGAAGAVAAGRVHWMERAAARRTPDLSTES